MKIISILFSKHETRLKQKLWSDLAYEIEYSYNPFFAFLTTMGTVLQKNKISKDTPQILRSLMSLYGKDKQFDN